MASPLFKKIVARPTSSSRTSGRASSSVSASTSRHCASSNPDLIYVSVSGFGDSGPYIDQKSYDYVIQALSGMAAVQADPATGEPALVRNIVIDKVTAMAAAQSILAALLARSRGAGGQHVRLSMLDVALSLSCGPTG